MRLIAAMACVALTAACAAGAGAAGENRDPELAKQLYELTKPVSAGAEPAKALPYLDKVLEADPEFDRAAFDAGNICIKIGDRKKAEEYFAKARNILKKKGVKDEEIDARIDTVKESAVELTGDEAEYAKLCGETVRALLERAGALEKEDKPYGAAKLVAKALQLNPADSGAGKARDRLGEKLGPGLAQALFGGWWADLFNGNDLNGWKAYSGVWEVDSRMLTVKRGGGMYLFHQSPPRRNCIVRMEANLNWGDSCSLLVRANQGGTGFRLGYACVRRTKDNLLLREFSEIEAESWNRWNMKKRFGRKEENEGGAVPPGQWVKLELECRGKSLVFRVDGAEWFKGEDDGEIAEGTIAVAASAGDGRNPPHLRNIRVLDLP